MSVLNKFDEIEILKNKIKSHCGLLFDGQRDTYFRQKVRDRVKMLELDNVAEYNHYLATQDDFSSEWQKLIDEVTINETYFFREKQQFDILKRSVLPRLMKVREPVRHIRILSAACANGSEPYSIAITLATKAMDKKWKIEIEGSDINENNLKIAREGAYTEFDLRNVDPLSKATYFESNHSRHMLLPSICKRVRFFQMNLLNSFTIRSQEPYQVIFCRNVFYYFDLPTRERVINALADSLTRGGYLFAGQTEFIGDLNIPFETCREADVVYYKKTSRTSRL